VSGVLPVLAEGQTLTVRELKPDQKFTQPPPRYNEGSLVKALEEDGIGRPSTYASIISVLQARDYVNKNDGRFRPTILGRRLVDKLLHPAFDDILDVEYTARMEEQLDDIEKGKASYAETLKDFYVKFKKDLKRAAKEMPNFKEGQPTGVTCDKCNEGEMVEKAGKFGIFLACSRYPDCDNTKELEPAEELCETDAGHRQHEMIKPVDPHGTLPSPSSAVGGEHRPRICLHTDSSYLATPARKRQIRTVKASAVVHKYPDPPARVVLARDSRRIKAVVQACALIGITMRPGDALLSACQRMRAAGSPVR
jgi:ssDNA-binding Zn-finger/Zn-ribbon topoisomerase 1